MQVEFMKVSVCMITYNHEKFIGQAIESVMMQQADFDYELVIGEDCSTDRTRAVVVDYAGRHPDRIRPLLRERNLGMNPNFVQTFQSCHGEYVALLDGDDYWTDPLKLQKQADYLSSYPDHAACFHAVSFIHENSSKEQKISRPPDRRAEYSLSDVLGDKYYWIHASSMFVRNHLIEEFPEWFYEMPMGDLPFIILNARKGRIGYMDDVMSTYRIHEEGNWSQAAEAPDLERAIAARDILIRHLDEESRQILRRVQHLLYLDLLRSYLSAGDHDRARMIAWKGLKGFYYSKNRSFGALWRLALNIYAPRIYHFLANH
ncbi:MAG: glycosyltransferase [Thermodesulfobacteriota bacterium]